MSKVEHIRPRYVAVRIEGDQAVARKAFAQAVQNAARKAGWADGTLPTVSRYTWPHAAVRMEHTHAAAARALLGRLETVMDGEPRRPVPVRVMTLGTSGSLAGLARQTGVLAVREPRPGTAPAPTRTATAAAGGAPGQAGRRGRPAADDGSVAPRQPRHGMA